MTPLAQAISGALLQFVWQGLLVSMIVASAMLMLRNHGPQIRYLVCCVALMALAVLPVATAISLYDPTSTKLPGPAAVTLTIRAIWAGNVSIAAGWLSAAQPWLLRIWIVGVIFLSLRLGFLGARVAGLRRSGQAADARILAIAENLARRMGLRRALRVLVSVIPDGPSVAGWIRPVILLPASAILNLTPEQLEAILAHELAHLRRYDDVVNIAQAAIETLLFYHPAVWWISGRIRRERELCCDDLAVRTCGDALCYARALTVLEKMRTASPQLAMGALGGALENKDASLEFRIRRIVGAANREAMPSGAAGILALGLAMLCGIVYTGPAHGSSGVPRRQVAYPESARQNGIQGTVPVRVSVNASGEVDDAKALGGPRELRQAAVDSASTVRFAPQASASMKQVNVAFELAATVTSPAAPVPVVPAKADRTGPRWIDQSESIIGLAANAEKDPAHQLELLREWKRQYPNSDFSGQRTFMTARALLAVLGTPYRAAEADANALMASKQAGLELLTNLQGYFDDSVRPDSVGPEQWAQARRISELQVHSVFAWIAQIEKDDDAADAEFRKILEIDPQQASASYQLGTTIVWKIARQKETWRYPEAIYEFARALAVTGPDALDATEKDAAQSSLDKYYVNYHGSTEGIDDVLQQAAATALPPAGFHILSVVEVDQAARKAHAAWVTANPDLDLWRRTKAALTERGDDYFRQLRHAGFPTPSSDDDQSLMFRATVISQASPKELLVSVDNAAYGDALLKFDNKLRGKIEPGAELQFRGVVDAYRTDGYVLTFTVRNPEQNVIGLNANFIGTRRGNLLSRLFHRLFRA